MPNNVQESARETRNLVREATLLRSRGDLSGAIRLLESGINRDPGNPIVHRELGGYRLLTGDAGGAIQAFTAALKLTPKDSRSYFGLGKALKMGGSAIEAFHAFRKTAEAEPGFLPAYTELFAQLQHLLNWQEGLATLENGYRVAPESTAMAIALAVTYGKLQRPSEAEALFTEAFQSDAMAGPPYAHWLHEEGRFQDAERLLKSTINRDPSIGEAYHALAVANCFDLEKSTLADAAVQELQNETLRPEARMFLLYAVAKALDHAEEYEEAIRYYELANGAAYAIYNSAVRLSPETAEHSVQRVRSLYPPKLIESFSTQGTNDETPVFIVGMIRSGTTLLDQLLANHPQISSAGEQPFWVLNAPRMEFKWRNSGPDVQDLGRAAAKYLETIRSAASPYLRIVDKMPVNYLHLGLMRMCLPKARFIHLRRNPMDTAISIYTTYLGNATYFAYDQSNIVETYREYLAIIDYWRSCLPADRLLEIDYERLVVDKEGVLREIMRFCGLEWSDACLEGQSDRRTVSTPSLYTARQPVTTRSVERWRNYEPWLKELLRLKDLNHPKPSERK